MSKVSRVQSLKRPKTQESETQKPKDSKVQSLKNLKSPWQRSLKELEVSQVSEVSELAPLGLRSWFRYLGVLFQWDEHPRIWVWSLLIRGLLQSLLLCIYRSVCISTLTRGHEVWIKTRGTRSWIQAALILQILKKYLKW